MHHYVDKARDRETGEIVALKKVRMEKEKDGKLTGLNFESPESVREFLAERSCKYKWIVAEHLTSTLESVRRHTSDLNEGDTGATDLSAPQHCQPQEGCHGQQGRQACGSSSLPLDLSPSLCRSC